VSSAHGAAQPLLAGASGRQTWAMDTRLADLQRQLESIAEELAEIGYGKLKEAAESPNGEAEAQERRLSRARRSVMKAAALLGGGETATSS
jgi:hypothetical protein